VQYGVGRSIHCQLLTNTMILNLWYMRYGWGKTNGTVYGTHRDFHLVSEIFSVNSTYSTTFEPLYSDEYKKKDFGLSMQLPVQCPTLFGDHEGPAANYLEVKLALTT
jgi:hypothetical protein